MESILSIIKYIFSRKNVVNNDKSINDFFANGISFPQFISLVFDIPEIPQIDKNPKTLIEKIRNNNIALQYACQKNELIRKRNPSYLNDSDKANLLMLILTKQRFKINIDDIVDKCNIIVQTLNIKFVEKKDIITLNCILSILHVLTDREVPIPNDLNQTKKIDKLLKNSFQKAAVPLIINENSFNEENQDIFLIQLEIIFEIFSEKVNLIQNSSQKVVNEQKSDKETKFKLSNFKPKVFIGNHQQYSGIIEYEKQALLKTLNFIGKDKFHFDNFQETVINDTIPKFVLYFFNIQAIENVHINESKSLQALKNTKITKEEIENIQAVIEFLKEKEATFQILKLDFGNPEYLESSAVSFYSNFLNFFFIKQLKSEFIDRCSILLSTKVLCIKTLEFKIYSALLHFYIEKNLHFNYSDLPNKDEQIFKLFAKAKIPMIINEVFFKSDSQSMYIEMSNALFYQLQIIFNAIDSGPKSLSIIESLLYVFYNFKKIKVPQYDLIAASIRVKRTSLELQHIRYEQLLHRTDSQSVSEEISTDEIIKTKREIINPPKSYKERQKESGKFQNKLQKTNNINDSVEIESFDSFWNSPDPSFGYDNGIIYDKLQNEENSIKSIQIWENEIENIQKNISKSRKEPKNTSFVSQSSTVQLRIYKFFYFDEKTNDWCFDSKMYDQFLAEKSIDLKKSKNPLIFIMNSFEQDSVTMISKLIDDSYPKIDENDDQIFVYGFCDKSLSNLNMFYR